MGENLDKEHGNKGKQNLKGKDNSLKEKINLKRSSLIIILGALLSVVILLYVFTVTWLYQTISMQEDKVNTLTKKLEQMPKPISQGRLGLMINKSNQNLEAKMRDDVIALQEKILEIRKEIEPFVDVPIIFTSIINKQRIFKAIINSYLMF